MFAHGWALWTKLARAVIPPPRFYYVHGRVWLFESRDSQWRCLSFPRLILQSAMAARERGEERFGAPTSVTKFARCVPDEKFSRLADVRTLVPASLRHPERRIINFWWRKVFSCQRQIRPTCSCVPTQSFYSFYSMPHSPPRSPCFSFQPVRRYRRPERTIIRGRGTTFETTFPGKSENDLLFQIPLTIHRE